MAMAVIEAKSGEISGLIGGRDQEGKRQFNRQLALDSLVRLSAYSRLCASCRRAIHCHCLDDYLKPIKHQEAIGL